MSYPYAFLPPSSGPDLLTIPKAALAYVVAYFAQAGVALPSRQYLAAGTSQTVAWDCEQVTMCLDNLGWGRSRDVTQLSPSFGKAASVGAERHGEWTLTIVRCHPAIEESGQLPTVDELEAAAELNWKDMSLLSQALVNFVAFPNDAVPIGGSVQAGAVSAVGPEGGYIGVNGTLTITTSQLDPPAPGMST